MSCCQNINIRLYGMDYGQPLSFWRHLRLPLPFHLFKSTSIKLSNAIRTSQRLTHPGVTEHRMGAVIPNVQPGMMREVKQ